jgi:hypothetical protein
MKDVAEQRDKALRSNSMSVHPDYVMVCMYAMLSVTGRSEGQLMAAGQCAIGCSRQTVGRATRSG